MMGSLLSSRALCGTAVALLLLSGCSPNGAMRAARASASSTAAVASNVPLCDVAAAGDVERVLNQQIRMFSCEHDGAFYASYSCRVYGFSEQQVEVEDFKVKFTELTTEIDLPGLYDAHTYSEAAALQRATRFTLDGTDGEGVTIPLETNNWAAVWQYPDGTVLTVLVSRNESIGEIPNGSKLAASIVEIFAPKVPQVAAGPRQRLIFYPEDSYRIPGWSDGSTPLTSWPSPSY